MPAESEDSDAMSFPPELGRIRTGLYGLTWNFRLEAIHQKIGVGMQFVVGPLGLYSNTTFVRFVQLQTAVPLV